jgi:IS4 transposase
MTYEKDIKELRRTWNEFIVRNDIKLVDEIFGFIKLGYLKGCRETNEEWYKWIKEKLKS